MTLVAPPALLVLEDGRTFEGQAYGATGVATGEIVFTTAMSGYQETFTDPSFRRQIVVMTAPHIGNTGINEEDPESRRIWVEGVVVRDPARRSSNWRSTGDLQDSLAEQGIVSISGVDTRAITRHLREVGVMRAGIFSGEGLAVNGVRRTDAELLDLVKATPEMAGADLAAEVTVEAPETIDPVGEFAGKEPVATVAVVDLGIKAMTNRRFTERGVRVELLPSTATIEDVLAVNPDGVFFSNGPGDPAAAEGPIALLREVLDRKLPYFGICFGNQILGRALGFGTYKLTYGHRGINQPVMDLNTGKVEITSQNHGFAVDIPVGEEVVAPHSTDYGRVRVSHICLNDNVVEGIECLDIPAMSVQYHPEAAAGPHDASYLFDRFVDLMTASKADAATTKEN